MTDRIPTSDLIATLRGMFWGWKEHPAKAPLNAAADRLAELEAKVARWGKQSNEMSGRTAKAEAGLAAIEALLPPCPTCGGTRFRRRYENGNPAADEPCPDCTDGKVSIERLVAEHNAIHGDGLLLDSRAVGGYLRGDLGDARADGGRAVIDFLKAVR